MNEQQRQAFDELMSKQDVVREWYKQHPDQILPDWLRDTLLQAEHDYTRAKEKAANEKR